MKNILILLKTTLSKVKILICIFIINVFQISSVSANEPIPSNIKGQWIHSHQLKPGMKIVTADNKTLIVKKPWSNPRTSKTYNFEVENNHTYFVGKQSL